jgi:predicted nucleic acid-binding protein
MITAVDSNVFFDLIAGEPAEAVLAQAALNKAMREGVVVLCTVVYAELSGRFVRRSELDVLLRTLRSVVEPIDIATAYLAGQHFRRYRQRGGDRTRILPDFLIGAHAELNADRLVTRDKRFFGESFPTLKAIRTADFV